MAFLQQVMCPNNMTRGTGSHNQQICFTNYNELFGVPRGTIFGVNANSLNRWKYVGEEWKGEQFLEPPFDYSGQTNYQIVLESSGKGTTSPNNASEAQRALGTMRCAPGTTPVWRGSANMRTTSGQLQPVSIWQCEVNGGPRAKPRTYTYQYA